MKSVNEYLDEQDKLASDSDYVERQSVVIAKALKDENEYISASGAKYDFSDFIAWIYNNIVRTVRYEAAIRLIATTSGSSQLIYAENLATRLDEYIEVFAIELAEADLAFLKGNKNDY